MTRPPYLPFLYGPPKMVPGLAPIEEREWLQPDTEAAEWLDAKRELMVRSRDDVLAILPSSRDACCEASRLIFDHLGVVNTLAYPTELEDAASYVSDDLCIMQQNNDDLWCLTAASLCAPTYWKLTENIGKPLSGLHKPVPGGDPELSSRIARIFSAISPGLIMERCNWTVQMGPERYTPSSALLKRAASNLADEDVLEQLHLRVERQTVRKLPNTNAVLFTIRICMDPLKTVFGVPGAKEAFRHAWAQASSDVSSYKGWGAYHRLIESVLG